MATSPSAARSAADPLLHILMGTLVASVGGDSPDLTARQLAIFLKVYLESGIEHTVRGLAADLNVSKPAITRALDRLEEFDFTKREKDRLDRRSVIARRTTTGSAYLRTLGGYMAQASKQVKK
jgi:DNA-binding MarR family transcriptional regulator